MRIGQDWMRLARAHHNAKISSCGHKFAVFERIRGVSHFTHPVFGLEALVEILLNRFEHDDAGRLVGLRGESLDGVLPRFVLGRARDGVIWRFRSGLSTNLVQAVARLAGRELGIPIDTQKVTPPPDRLFAIERLFSESDGRREPHVTALREEIVRGGIAVGELWTLE